VAVPPVWYGVSVGRNGCIGDVKQNLSRLCGVPPSRLVMCDVYENNVCEFIHDDWHVSKLGKDDVIGVYEVDPYTPATMHAIATHVDVEGASVDPARRTTFGYPLMTSFSIGLSCGEIWRHVWRQVSHLVLQQGGEEGKEEDEMEGVEGRIEYPIQIRVVDGQSRPRPIFRSGVSNDGQQQPDTSSLLPQSNQKLAAILGPDCSESFLFLHIEWRSAATTDHHPHPDPPTFIQPSYHPSYTAATGTATPSSSLHPPMTLDHCFENFISPEHLDEDNKWYCPRCRERVRARKTMEIWRLPNVLVVHLKRFEYRHALRRDKLETFVDCPTEGLDMGRYCASSTEYRPDDRGDGGRDEDDDRFDVTDIPAVYDLFAVTNHYGRMGFGHYTAVARRWNEHGIEEDWSMFDDTGVTQVDSGGVVSSAAYILFYRRRVFT